MTLRSRTAVASTALGLTGAAVLATAPVAAAATTGGTEIHVATNGSDSAPGTAASPLRSVAKAVTLARPGTTIKVHAGTYSGVVQIRTSGTASAPIVLTSAGDGPVRLTASHPTEPCNSSKPAPGRTIKIGDGADHWTIRGLTVDGGLSIYGTGSGAAYQWFNTKVDSGDWQGRRAVPGRSANDPTAARNAISYLQAKTGTRMDPSDGIVIENNTFTGRGLHVSLARYGRITGNRIQDVKCGTGPGVWLITFSDGWQINGNTVTRIAASTFKHYMQEGIRMGNSSNYNTVSNNLATDLPGDGRAFNTDVDSSFNTITHNRAERVAIGYNDQKGGWGNRWIGNTVTSYRVYGLAFRLASTAPGHAEMDVVTKGATVSCNVVNGTGDDLGIGRTVQSSFSSNTMNGFWLSSAARSSWSADGNTWNGSRSLPTVSTSTSRC